MKLEEHAFEGAVLFYGIMQNLSFTAKLIHQNTLEIKAIANATMKYLKVMVEMMIVEKTTVLDTQNVNIFIASFSKVELSIAECIEQFEAFRSTYETRLYKITAGCNGCFNG